MNPVEDRKLPENSQVNLDKKLDHAVKETFPTSDPVSVTVTKKAPDPASLPGAQSTSGTGSSNRSTTDSVPGQVSDTANAAYATAESTVRGAAEAAAGAARDTYQRGRAYARQAAESYPGVERQYRRTVSAVREYTPDNPLIIFMAGAAVGFTVAWLMKSSRSNEGVPDYARTEGGYAPHRQRR